MEVINVKLKRSDGLSFTFEDEAWGVCELTGIEFPEIEIFTANKGLGNGSIVTGKRKAARNIELHARQRRRPAPLFFAQERTRLLAFLNPSYSYTINMTVLGRTMQARDCELLAAAYPTVQVEEQNPELVVQFLSPEADLFADTTSEQSFTTRTPMWHVTRVYEFEGGTQVFGTLDLSTTQVVNYIGSEPTPVQITIRATGLLEGILATVNGVSLTVDEEMNSGDVMVIDAEERTITLNGTALAPSEIDMPTLRQFLLQFGDNTVTVTTTNGSIEFTAELGYTGRYGGV